MKKKRKKEGRMEIKKERKERRKWELSSCVFFSADFQAAHVLELFLVPAESILEASWLSQNWLARQILDSLLVTWSTDSGLPCQGVYLMPLPDLWLPSWLPPAVFLVSAHLLGFACVASESNMDPAVGLVTAEPCCQLLHWCVPFLTKPLAHTSPLPCLSQRPTSELTSSPTYSASLSSSPALAL